MNSSILQSLASKSPLPTNLLLLKPSSSPTCNYLSFPRRRRRLPKVYNSTVDNNSEAAKPPVPPPVRPPSDTLQIRFKRGSRRRRQLWEEGARGEGQRMNSKAAAEAAPKKWEEMSMTEKALELYVGENGLLFWLNKFAYASIFIVIGAWIVFRFVGHALNLYQLDSPLAPTSMFNGS
ncbi:Zinc finger family protein, putative isoform 1 [Hibiscus syriacus]|uniref:Zinc finger family protein, putative isoform 1 n=1 Tax=Hibiscus syriacus TaxID=106335 RepID=A0A6A3AFW0_HIBSY|nr:uncharacterized protein LOC120130123 [Hibiscus syriacus]KAE8701702.1 Zinc finger family protein, putative isoform 1 [Hibiscus syriacus]